ncbi:MAG: TetR/AcrR family transcriptional regulator [Anaerolineales bacterium]|nr:TetR/AcrR family transcriptional regulator [Anaerolineales bacterium]
MANTATGLDEQILETAKDLFINKGYHGLSMREISDALDVSKAALYYYFKDKEELFLAILKVYLDDMSEALDRIQSEAAPRREQIRHFIEYVLAQPSKQRATIRLASQEIVHLTPKARKAFDALYREKFVGKVQSILQQGMDNGEFRKMRAEAAVWGLLGIMFPYFYPAHSGDSPVPDETIQEVATIFLDGICK